jgi:hypothetical protein
MSSTAPTHEHDFRDGVSIPNKTAGAVSDATPHQIVAMHGAGDRGQGSGCPADHWLSGR